MLIYELYIPDMMCASCFTPIEATLKKLPSITSITPEYTTHVVTIVIDEQRSVDEEWPNTIYDGLNDVGFPYKLIIERTSLSNTDNNQPDRARAQFHLKMQQEQRNNIRLYWLKGVVGIIVGLSLLVMSMLGMGIPFAAMLVIASVSTLLTLYFGKDTYRRAWLSFINARTLSMDTLFSISTLVALGVSWLSFFIPGLPMLFEAALLIFGFKNIGKGIEESAKKQVTQQSFCATAATTVLVKQKNTIFKEIAVSALQVNDIIQVRRGQIIPVNGVCVSSSTTIYNTIITGKTVPQRIVANDCIYAGCSVPNDVDFIELRVVNTVENSYLAFLDTRISAALQEKSNLETAAERSLRYFIPIVVGIAIISAIFVGFFISPFAAVQCLIAVLVSACPCTLGLITPLVMRTAIIKAAAYGVVFKSGQSIEDAVDVDTVVFDLNGTLTIGKPEVTQWQLPSEICELVAAIEAKSLHPFAQAICRYTTEHLPITATTTDFANMTVDLSHHAGIVARVNGDNFVIGNRLIMQDKNIDMTGMNDGELKAAAAEHIVYVAKNGVVCGYVVLKDPLRDDARATVQELLRQGKHIHICTGEDTETALQYARILGIKAENVCGGCLPDSEDDNVNAKSRYIKQLKSQGRKVAMVGDAANDAVAVASCFGIAIQSSSNAHAVTQVQAAAVIERGSLWSIVNAFTIAQQTIRNIKQNLWLSIAYNMLAMIAFSGVLLAIGFAINPAFGAALMVLQTVIILLNVWWFKQRALPASHCCYEQSRLPAEGVTAMRQTYSTVPTMLPQPQPQPMLASGAAQGVVTTDAHYSRVLSPPPAGFAVLPALEGAPQLEVNLANNTIR